MSDISESDLAALPVVAHVESDSRVVINQGREHGLKVGQRFQLFGIGREIFDPRTKESLGRLESVRGTGKIFHLQDKMAVLHSDMSIPGTRITKKPDPRSILSHFQPQFIEEEQTPPTQIGFANAEVGDYAKPL